MPKGLSVWDHAFCEKCRVKITKGEEKRAFDFKIKKYHRRCFVILVNFHLRKFYPKIKVFNFKKIKEKVIEAVKFIKDKPVEEFEHELKFFLDTLKYVFQMEINQPEVLAKVISQ